MFARTSNNPLKQPASKLAYGLAAAAGAAILAATVLAGSVAVSAKTSQAETAVQAPAATERAIAFNARPLTISVKPAAQSSNVRVIKIFDVSADQQKFASR